MQPSKEAYDRASTIFSPDGRLFQVEYAREAVKRGTTTIGLKFKDGVVLINELGLTWTQTEPKNYTPDWKDIPMIECRLNHLCIVHK